MDKIRQEIYQATAQLRTLVKDLRPAGLEDFGFVSALGGYLSHLQDQTTLHYPKIKFSVEPDPNDARDIPELIAVGLFRVVQEALRNVAKHAQASLVQLQIGIQKDGISISICDDGCGFRVPSRMSELVYQDHFGLVGMTERIASMDGKLDIRSETGKGTEIRIWVPLEEIRIEDVNSNIAG